MTSLDEPNLDDIMNESGTDSDEQSQGENAHEESKAENKVSEEALLVNPNTQVMPTPKSDGVAIKARADSARQNENGNDDDDLEDFSDINSQDEALVRERKEKSGLRRDMKNLAQNLMSKANNLIQTPVSALTALGRTNTVPFADDLKSPLEVRGEKAKSGTLAEDDAGTKGDDKMSDDE